MTPSINQDHEALRTRAYANPAPLRARVELYAYRAHPKDYLAWVLGHVDLAPGIRVLDVGCGDGRALQPLAAAGAWTVGLDLSEGMVGAVSGAPASTPLVCADVADLPLASDSFDLALALHMLYHVPDLGRALADIRRVLRSGGRLLVSTMAGHHLSELHHLVARAVADAAGTTVAPPWATERAGATFLLDEAAAVLAGAGFVIEGFDIDEDRVRLTDASPALAFIASTRHLRPPSLDWESVMTAAAARIDDEIAASGTWEITVASGVVLARSPS